MFEKKIGKSFRRVFGSLVCLATVGSASVLGLETGTATFHGSELHVHDLHEHDLNACYSCMLTQESLELMEPSFGQGRSSRELTIQHYGFESGEIQEKEFFTFGSQYLTGDLVAQGEHCNIWVVRPNQVSYTGKNAGEFVTVRETGVLMQQDGVSYSDEKALEIAQKLDVVYGKLNAIILHDGVLVEGAYGNIPEIGDIDLDGRVNILLYDIDEGVSSGIMGYFHTSCFMTTYYDTPIDLVHMDIGKGEGFDGSKNQVSDIFYGSFAHELQHLLFYMYLGCFLSDANEYLWVNESLSGFADLYYGDVSVAEGQNPLSMTTSTLISASRNDYSYNGAYGDFLNFTSSGKSYAMSYFFSVYLHELKVDFLEELYRYFQGNIVENSKEKYKYSQFETLGYYTMFEGIWGQGTQGKERVSMMEVLSDGFSFAFHGEAGLISDFYDVYQSYMESFCSNGGVVVGISGTRQTRSLFETGRYSLWSFRTGYDILKSGETIQLKGHGYSELFSGATHETTYLLDRTGYHVNNQYLHLSLEDTGSERVRAYVVLQHGSTADLIEIPLGKELVMKVESSDIVYLFFTTYYENYESVLTYAWLNEEGVVGEPPEPPASGNTIPDEPEMEEGYAGISLCNLALEVTGEQPKVSYGILGDFTEVKLYYSTSEATVVQGTAAYRTLEPVELAHGMEIGYSDLASILGFTPSSGRTYYLRLVGTLAEEAIVSSDVVACVTEDPEVMEVSFDDVSQEDWYGDYIAHVVSLSVMDGVDGYFYPEDYCSRGAVAEYFWNLNRSDVTPFREALVFQDVFHTGYETAVAWCVSHAVMSGYGEGMFGVADLLTREQFAVALAGLSNSLGYETQGDVEILNEFLDGDRVSDWAVSGVSWCIQEGLLAGDEKQLHPQGMITRGEMAAMLSSYMKRYM